jgi:CrcB protein
MRIAGAAMTYVCVLIGGGLGALTRYLTTEAIQSAVKTKFPAGTLLVNAAGAFLIGFLFKIFETRAVPSEPQFFALTGFLGGYTTFSTYSLETAHYFINGDISKGLLNIFLNNGLCLVCAALGLRLGR